MVDIAEDLVFVALGVLLVAFWGAVARRDLEGGLKVGIFGVEGLDGGVDGVFEVGLIEMFDLGLIGKDEHLQLVLLRCLRLAFCISQQLFLEVGLRLCYSGQFLWRIFCLGQQTARV